MSKKFEHTIYKNYLSTHFKSFNTEITRAWKSRYYLWISYFEDFVPKQTDARILEIGSGMGHNLYALRRMKFTRVFGFDISKECVDFCTEKKLPMVSYRSLETLVKKIGVNDKYELILLYDLMEHFTAEEASQMLGNIKKLLTSNGKILISTPNGEFPLNLSIRYVDISHKLLYTGASLTQLLHINGLTVADMRSIPSFTLRDDNIGIEMFKRFIMRPVSAFSESLLKIYLLSLGIQLRYPRPQLICLAQDMHDKE